MIMGAKLVKEESLSRGLATLYFRAPGAAGRLRNGSRSCSRARPLPSSGGRELATLPAGS